MWFDGDPLAVALTWGGMAITYAELAARVDRAARRIAAHDGVIAVRAGNDVNTVIVLLAGLEIGRPVALLPPASSATDLVTYRELLGQAVEFDGEGSVVWEARRRSLVYHPDAALIAFTSGSTGQPRAIQLSRPHLELNTANCVEMVGMREVREQMVFAPISHLFALMGHLLPGLQAGLTTHLYNGVAEIRGVIEHGEARGILSGVPAHWEALLRYCRPDPALYQRVTRLVSSGAPLGEGLRRRLAKGFESAVILNGYGLSEAPRILALSSRHPRFFSDATGLPTRGAELSIAADGELRIRGALVMLGYLGDRAATEARIRDGWLYTGDAAHASDDDIFTVFGRLDEVRKVGGERVNLVEIDQELIRLTGVEDAATTVEADVIYGERLVAFLVGDLTLAARSRAALRDELARRIAWHKVPSRFYVTKTIPRNRVGKLQRGLLLALQETAQEFR